MKSVNRSILEKRTNQELEKYLLKENRYVADAVQFAFEILESRGRVFSEADRQEVEELILKKREQEVSVLVREIEDFEDYVTLDPEAIQLFSRNNVLQCSIIFGLPFGMLLQLYNLQKLKLFRPLVLITLLTVTFTVMQYFATAYLEEYFAQSSEIKQASRGEFLKPYFVTLIFQITIFCVSLTYLSKKIEYRSKSILIPYFIFLLSNLVLYKLLGNIHGFSMLFILFNKFNN